MDYKKHYNLLVDKARKRNLEGYRENHHIVPRSEGGSDDKSNIVALTAREHFVAHWLLYRMDPKNTSRAFSFWRMCNGRGKVRYEDWTVIPSRAYEEGRIAFGKAISKTLKGRNKTKEHVQKVANANRGKKRTLEQRERMSIAAKKRGPGAGYAAMIKSVRKNAHKRWVPIQMLDANTEVVLKEFDSVKQAAKHVNRDSSNIVVAAKYNKTSAGFKWRYKLHN